MSDDTAKRLAAAAELARLVNRVLPTDDKADRIISALLRANRPQRGASRKLLPKAKR